MPRRLLSDPAALVEIVPSAVPPLPDWVCIYWEPSSLEMTSWVEYTADALTVGLSTVTMPAGDGPSTNRYASVDVARWPECWWCSLIGGVIVLVELRSGLGIQIEAQIGTIQQPIVTGGQVRWVEHDGASAVAFSAELPDASPVEGETYTGTMRGWMPTPGGLAAIIEDGSAITLTSPDPASFDVADGAGDSQPTRWPGQHSGEDLGGPTYVAIGHFADGNGGGDQLRNPGGEGFIFTRNFGPVASGAVADEILDSDGLGCSVRPHNVAMLAYPYGGYGTGAWLSFEGPSSPENSSTASTVGLIDHGLGPPHQAFPVAVADPFG